jgi:hypothetical protein
VRIAPFENLLVRFAREDKFLHVLVFDAEKIQAASVEAASQMFASLGSSS